MEFGYVRISTPKQNPERQIRNIKSVYPKAVMIVEIYTGTKFQGRNEMDKLLRIVKPADKMIFDSVSRMSRSADDGWELYKSLYDKGIELVFLKEPYVNTETYRSAIHNQIKMTGDDVDLILNGINQYLMRLAEKQIRIAFEQAEKEVKDLHQRTSEGIQTARIAGKQIGQKKGVKLHVKKEEPAKEKIRKYDKTFGGQLTNQQTWELIGISKQTFYKYKKEILNGLNR